MAPDGDALVMEIQATGAKLKLEPWDGDVFIGQPHADSADSPPIVENLGPLPIGFVQFQMDKEAKLNLLRLSYDDGQAYEFRRE